MSTQACCDGCGRDLCAVPRWYFVDGYGILCAECEQKVNGPLPVIPEETLAEMAAESEIPAELRGVKEEKPWWDETEDGKGEG